jgi:hypothetical protein
MRTSRHTESTRYLCSTVLFGLNGRWPQSANLLPRGHSKTNDLRPKVPPAAPPDMPDHQVEKANVHLGKQGYRLVREGDRLVLYREVGGLVSRVR